MNSEQPILEELRAFARQVADRARPLADDVEVLVIRRDLVGFSIENRHLSPELKLGRLQVGLRALRGGRLAMAATTSLDVDENVAAIRAALPAGRPTRTERFSSQQLPSDPRGFSDPLARYVRDPGTLQSVAASVRDHAFRAAAQTPHFESFEGRIVAQTRWIAIATAAGEGASVENGLAAFAEVNSARTERLMLREPDEQQLMLLGERAVRSFPPKPLAPRDLGLGAAAPVTAILAPELLEQLFRHPAHDHFLASSKLSGQTGLEVGAEIADRRIRLVDTGLHPLLWRPFDDELTPGGETALINEGRFSSFVSSRTSAALTGHPATGNGFRRPILTEDISEAPVRDKLGGLEMGEGTRTSGEMIAGEGLAILPRAVLGIHGADRARTTFSVTVADGVAIRDGKVVGHLAPGQWNLSGRVLPGDGETGLLLGAEPSSDRIFTGFAVLPFLRTTLRVG